MKKIRYVIIISFIICFCNPTIIAPTSLEFQNDLGSENNRLAGAMSRLPQFNRNLETLTYDFYIEYLKNNVANSAEEIVDVVINSDDHYFTAKQYSFCLLLLYKSNRIIVCDISNTAFIDSVQTYAADQAIPSLEEFFTAVGY